MQKDNNLKDRFADFGSAPSEKVWAGIESGLTGKKKKVGLFWWWTMGSAATVLLACGIIYSSYNNQAETKLSSKEVNKQNAEKQSEDQKNATDSSAVDLKNKNFNTSITTNKKIKTNSDNKNDKYLNQVIPVSKKFTPYSQKIKLQIEKREKFESAKQIQPRVDDKKDLTFKFMNIHPNLDFKGLNSGSYFQDSLYRSQLSPRQIVSLDSPTSRWQFGLRYGFWISPTSELVSQENIDFSLPPSGGSVAEISAASPINSQPLITPSLRLTVGYDLTERIQITSGLGYSTFRSRNNNIEFQTISSPKFARTIHIPISFNYSFISLDKLRGYIGLGTTNALIFPGFNLNSVDFTNDLQFHFGAQFQVIKGFSIDIQPSARYILVDSRKVFSQNKLLLGGSIGLLYTPKRKN